MLPIAPPRASSAPANRARTPESEAKKQLSNPVLKNFVSELVNTHLYKELIGGLDAKYVQGEFNNSDTAFLQTELRQIAFLYEAQKRNIKYRVLEDQAGQYHALEFVKGIVILSEIDIRHGGQGVYTQVKNSLETYKGYKKPIYFCVNKGAKQNADGKLGNHFTTLVVIPETDHKKQLTGKGKYRYIDPLYNNNGDWIELNQGHVDGFGNALMIAFPQGVDVLPTKYFKQQQYSDNSKLHNNECGLHNIFNMLLMLLQGPSANIATMRKHLLDIPGPNETRNGGIDSLDAEKYLRPTYKELFAAILNASNNQLAQQVKHNTNKKDDQKINSPKSFLPKLIQVAAAPDKAKPTITKNLDPHIKSFGEGLSKESPLMDLTVTTDKLEFPKNKGGEAHQKLNFPPISKNTSAKITQKSSFLPSSSSVKPILNVSKPELKNIPAKIVDYAALTRAMISIEKNHNSNLQQYQEKKSQLDKELKRIQIASDEKLCLAVIADVKKQIVVLTTANDENTAFLKSAKERSALLQQKLHEIEQKNNEQDIAKDVDKAVESVIKREVLQQLETKNSLIAQSRKIPLQQATLAGRIKEARNTEQRIIDAMTIMQNEYAKLQQQETKLQAEHKELKESLVERQAELVVCFANEKQKQAEYDVSDANLNQHKNTVNTKVNEYNSTRNQITSSLASAKQALSALENSRAEIEADIRQTDLTIQSLQGRTRKTIMVPKQVLKKWSTWHGHLWGWRHHEAWVTENIPTDVEDTDVTHQIRVKTNHRNNQQTNLNNKNNSINNKNTEINNLQTRLEQHDQAWVATKTELNKQLYVFEEKQRQAGDHLRDATAKRLQKENEISFLNDAITSKTAEIQSKQAEIKRKSDTISVFQKKLDQCRDEILKTQQAATEQAAKQETVATQIANVQDTKHDLDTKKRNELLQAQAEAKALFDKSCLDEAKFASEAVILQAKLEQAQQRLKELTHPDDAAIATKRKEQELACQIQIDAIALQIQTTEEKYQEFHKSLLLGQGLFLSGYKQSADVLDNVIICLLQGVFESDQVYHFNSAVNMARPENWQKQLEKIKNKFTKSNVIQQQITPEQIITLVNLINEEFQYDQEIAAINVALLGRALPTKVIAGKKSNHLNLWLEGRDCLLLAQEGDQVKHGVSVRTQRLITALLPPHQLFNELCQAIILRDCGEVLGKCAPEQLANYCREELQFDLNKLIADKPQNALFKLWFEKIFKHIAITFAPTTDAKTTQLQALHYCLDNVAKNYAELKDAQQQEVLQTCYQQYLTTLKTLIMGELKKRAENENNAQRLVDENKADLSNKMHGLASETKKQQEVLDQYAVEIANKKQRLEKKQQQTAQLKQNCEQQTAEIESKIQDLIKIKNQVNQELEKISESGGNHEERIKALTEQRQEATKKLAELDKEKAKVLTQLEETKKAQAQLEQEKIKIDSDQKKYEERAEKCKASKKREDSKIKFIGSWRDFLKSVHEKLLNDKDAFLKRHALLKTFSTDNKDSKQEDAAVLQEYYNALIAIPCLKMLDTAQMQEVMRDANKDDFKIMTTSWPNDLRNVLEDVLGSPHIHIDGANPIVIKGNNISWVEAEEELKQAIAKRLKQFGFGFNEKNKLIVTNAGLVGIINQLPERLQKLFARHIELHYPHYTIANENQVDQTPRWHVRERFLSVEEITEIVDKANIDFYEVLRVYTDSIELTAAHNLYLDENIYLPGINVTCFSKESIHCKDDLVINTTPKQLGKINIPKAANGDAYAIGVCREGDDGLDGQAGDCAGHIIVKAENIIKNLTKIKCIANGTNGIAGQEAGNGGTGHKGVDMPDAQATDTDGAGKAQYILARGRTPGMNVRGEFTPELAGEKSGPGADAGKAGLGGGESFAGDVVIMDKKNEARFLAASNTKTGNAVAQLQQRIEQKNGTAGKDAESKAIGGMGGEPGVVGLDHLRNKRSFFDKTTEARCRVSDSDYALLRRDPMEYSEPDSACGLNVSIFGKFLSNSNDVDTGEIRVYGRSTHMPYMAEEVFKQHPTRRDERSRGKQGRNNNEINRKKNPADRRKTQQTQTMQQQLAQLSRIDQTATSMQQNHAITKHDNIYKTEMAVYEEQAKKLGQEMQQCTEQAAICEKRAGVLHNQIEQTKQTVTQLNTHLSQIKQMLDNVDKVINANDIAQLQNFQQQSELNSKILQTQTELACANIDVDSKKDVQMQFAELQAAIQNALLLQQNIIAQDIQATEAMRLQQAERLALMQQEYARLEQAYSANTQQQSKESHLLRLADELARTEQRQQRQHLSHQINTLADGKQLDAKKSSLIRISAAPKNMFFTLPSLQEQCEDVIALFSTIFPRSVKAINDLNKELKSANNEKLWVITLNSLQAELSTLKESEQFIRGKKAYKKIVMLSTNSKAPSQVIDDAIVLQKTENQVIAFWSNKGVVVSKIVNLSENLNIFEGFTDKTREVHDQKFVGEVVSLCSRTRLDELKTLLAYCEKILKLSTCTIGGLKQIYAQIVALSRNNNTSEILFAIKNIGDVLEQKYLDLLIAQCVAASKDGKEIKLYQKLLTEAFKNALLVRSETNPPSKYDDQLINKFNFLQSIADFIANKQDQKYLNSGKPFAELINIILENTERAYPTTTDENGEFIAESQKVLAKFELKAVPQNNSHKNTQQTRFYFAKLQLEIEYIYIAAVKKFEVLEQEKIKEPSPQAVLAQQEKMLTALTKGNKQLTEIIKSLVPANNEYTRNLLQQAAKNKQILAIMEKQIRFKTVNVDEKQLPVARCQLLVNLYEETVNCIDTSRTNLQRLAKDLHAMAQQSLEHFIETAPVTLDEWQAILMRDDNIVALKNPQTNLLRLIIKRIIASNEVKLFLPVYQRCQLLLQKDQQFKNKFAGKLKTLWHSALEKQLEIIQERLINKNKVLSDNTPIVNEMLQILGQISMLWCSAQHCLVPMEKCLATLSQLQLMEPTTETLQKLRVLAKEQFVEQKQLLLKQHTVARSNGNNDDKRSQDNNKEITFAGLLNNAVVKISGSFINKDVKEQVSKRENTIRDLDKCLLTLNLLISNKPLLLDEKDLELIEKTQSSLQQMLIKYLPVNDKDQEYNAFWQLLRERSHQYQTLLDDYYYDFIKDKFSRAKAQCQENRQKISSLMDDILKHYDDCVRTKQVNESQHLSAEEKDFGLDKKHDAASAAKIKTANDKANRYYASQRYFIELLLKKIEHSYLIYDDEKSGDSMVLLQLQLMQIKQTVTMYDGNYKSSLEKIERLLINKVNERGLQVVKTQQLFSTGKCPVVFNNELQELKTVIEEKNADFSKLFSVWLIAIKTIFANLNKTQNYEAWLVDFIKDSQRLLIMIVPESEKQEQALYDIGLTMQLWLDGISADKRQLIAEPLKQLVQLINYSIHQSNHYLFASRLLEMQNKEGMTQATDKRWLEVEQYTLQALFSAFIDINQDFGVTGSKYKLVNKLTDIKPVYNLQQCQQKLENIKQTIALTQANLSLPAPVAKANDSKKDDKATVKESKFADRLNSINAMDIFEISRLRKIFFTLKQLPKEELLGAKKFIINFVNYQQTQADKLNNEQKYYCNLITALLTNRPTSGAIVLEVLLDTDLATKLSVSPSSSPAPSPRTSRIFNNKEFNQFVDSLTKRECTWKVPYFIALLPLIKPKQFTQKNYEEVIEKLINGAYPLAPTQRLELLQVVIKCYGSMIISALEKEKNSVNNGLVTRALAYINRYLTAYQQSYDHNSKQQISLDEVRNYSRFMRDINVNSSLQTIKLENLLMPIEAVLYERIVTNDSKSTIKETLTNLDPELWSETIRAAYFEVMVNAFIKNTVSNEQGRAQFEDLFSSAYLAALNGNNEQNWLQDIDYLLSIVKRNQLDIRHITYILQSVIAVNSAQYIDACLAEKMPPLAFVKESLFSECLCAIQNCIKDEKQQELSKQFLELKAAIFNSDENGMLFLRKFGHALVKYAGLKESRLYLYPTYLQELLSLIKETQAYKQNHLLSDKTKILNDEDILQWNYQLKRERYVQLFGLQEDGASVDIDKLAHYLNRIENDKSTVLVNRLAELIKVNIVYFTNLSKLNGFLANFANNYWELDDAILDKLIAMPVIDWHAHLDKIANQRFNESLQGNRTPLVVVQEMRKEIDGINHPVRHLLEPGEDKQCYIEKRIAEAEEKCQAYKNWNEKNIGEWAEVFKKSAAQELDKPEKLVEFLAVLIRACELKLNKTPRATQLTALILFIDAIQKGKGRLANISTGEGKSLITVMSAISLALRGERVDIVTSNEVLAERDAKSAETLLNVFGIKVSNNCDNACEKNEDLRRERYNNCQVIFGTTGSFQRDLLLTNFFGKRIRGLPGEARPGNTLLIDEVDSMFIDNAEKILYISHSIQDLRHVNDLFMMIWATVNSPERFSRTDVNVKAVKDSIEQKIDDNSITLPNTLREFIKRRLEIWIENAYMAKNMEAEKQYTIPQKGEKQGKAVVMDLDTGVEQTNTQWSNGLHQFIQLKHSQKLTPESLKAVFMANIIFFQSYQGHIIGMTGTLGAKVELDLMSNPKIYGVDFFRLPRNKPERYQQEESIIAKPTNEQGEWIGVRESWRRMIVKDVSDKQCKSGSHDDKAIAQAKVEIKAAKQRLIKLEQNQALIEKTLQHEIDNTKLLKKQIDELDAQLKRDAVVQSENNSDQNSTPKLPREALIETQQMKSAELQTNEEKITQLKLKLDNLQFGDDGINFNRNKERNAKYTIENRGSRAVLIICENIKDALDLKAAMLADHVLGKRNIITLTSKDDPLPHDKLGPEDIIIATNIAGRGTDFETLDILDKNGGLHVILASVPPNVRVETQAFRRTARNGKRGTGRFIVYDPRLDVHPDSNISVDLMRAERDIDEARRIDRICTQGIPKLVREQMLFVKFIDLQKAVRTKLEAEIKNPKDYDLKWVEVQIKSLQNKWAFFLDALDAKIGDHENVSDNELLREYQVFVDQVWNLMSSVPFRLITEPAELLRMARYSLDPKISKHHSDEAGYQLAEEYLDAIIEKEPQFAEMAHYYKALCNFGRKQNSVDSKRSARRSLKKAIDLFDERIGRLSSSAQSLRYIRGRKQESGKGLEVDEFSANVSREISLLQIHINAAREVLGTELNPESFKSGTVTGKEHETIFNNRNKLNFPHFSVIKDYRVSKKVTIEQKAEKDEKTAEKAIYYNGKRVHLPRAFAAARDKIIAILETKLANKDDLAKRQLHPEAFKDLFITKQQFLDGIQNHCKKQPAINLHPEIQHNLDVKGQWDTGVFSDCKAEIGLKIKQLILNLETVHSEDDLLNKIVQIGVSKVKAKEIVKHLADQSIVQIKEMYLLSGALQDKIKAFFAKNKDKETSANPPRLIQHLELDKVFPNMAHHRDVEENLLHIYENSNKGIAAEILLEEDNTARYTQLWSYLKSEKVVKDPAVNFKLQQDPDKLLDAIKKHIEQNINLLLEQKDEDQRKKYSKSVYQTLEKAIGKIKQFEKLKIEPKTLQDFLQGGKVPPELVDFTQQCYDIVISLAEDKGFDWGIIAVALMGLIQIAAGVLISFFTFGAAAYISAVLISEGVSDLMFAVQAGINGNFSWAAYGEHKWQSLLISCATAGIAVGIGGAASAATNTSLTFASFAQQLAVELGKAGLAIALSTATDQLVKQVLSHILNELERDFESWVRNSPAYQIAEGKLQTLIGNFYDKFGAVEAERIINQVIADNTQERSENFANIFSAKLSETMQKLSSHLSIAAGGGNSTAKLIGSILSVASEVAKAADIIRKLQEVASMTSNILNTLEKSLQRAYNKDADNKNVGQKQDQTKQKADFSKKILDQQTKIIVGEVKQFIKANIMQPGTQALLQMAVKPLNELLNKEATRELQEVEERIKDAAAQAENEEVAAAADDATDTTGSTASATQTVTPAPNAKKYNHGTANTESDSKNVKDVKKDKQTLAHGTNKKAQSFAKKIQQKTENNKSTSLKDELDYQRMMALDAPVEQSFDLFDVVGVAQLGVGAAKLLPQAPKLLKGAVAFAKEAGPAIMQAVKNPSAALSRLGLFAGKTASSTPSQTLVGTSTRQMRREAQKIIASDPNHPLKFLLNNEGKFYKTRGLSHAELMDNPRLIQMGHITSKASGASERIMLQGAWENQLNAITIERASIGGYVRNTAIDIGGIAMDLRTAQSLERYGMLRPGTVSSATRIKP